MAGGPEELGMGVADVETGQPAPPPVPQDGPAGEPVVDLSTHQIECTDGTAGTVIDTFDGRCNVCRYIGSIYRGETDDRKRTGTDGCWSWPSWGC
jgi:hypothetical protein